jgi:ectoine hydroxylase-related dioxygenase (phytanoyl-CoA dioxygenase family)
MASQHISVMVCVDAATIENGCLEVCYHPHCIITTAQHNPENPTFMHFHYNIHCWKFRFAYVSQLLAHFAYVNCLLQVAAGQWEKDQVPLTSTGVVQPEAEATMNFEYVQTVPGDVFLFSGYLPHR